MKSLLCVGLAVAAMIVLSSAGSAVGRSETASLEGGLKSAACQPLPAAVQGVFRRADNFDWRLLLAQCRFTIRGPLFTGGADYELVSGDATSGEIVVSNDRGCRRDGEPDLPTSYTYAFAALKLDLLVKGGISADQCGGRSANLARTWLKTPNGRVTISYDAKIGRRVSGTFVLSGAGSDRGKAILHRGPQRKGVTLVRTTLRGARGSLVLSETVRAKGLSTWTISSGTDLYQGSIGKGKEVVITRGVRVHVILTGTIST
jgi:hypothetical protein